MDKIPMTQAGFTSADNELKQLKSVDRPSVIKAIAEAREHGDLSENAEYHSARELQSHIEGRIKELEAIISLAQIIEVSKLSGNIKFGATVQLVDEDTDAERTLQIVGEHEANIENNPVISQTSLNSFKISTFEELIKVNENFRASANN